MGDINKVKDFWENNPLFTGESPSEAGSDDFFMQHTDVYLNDCFPSEFDKQCFPINLNNKNVLDLGCGIGFWIEQLSKENPKKIVACDLTENALILSRKRCKFLSIKNVEFIQANAENLPFNDNEFDFINCQGVIHHTPNTQKALDEIYRCLKPNGKFSISVYYQNIFLRTWPFLRHLGKILYFFGAKLKGRNREKIFLSKSTEDLVMHYDGLDNPIGKSYSRKEILKLFAKSNLKVKKSFLHFFPRRSLPFKINNKIHKFLDQNFGFIIYLTGKK